MKSELEPGFVSLFNERGQGATQLDLKGEGQGTAHHLSGKEVLRCVKAPCFDPPSPRPPCFR